MQFVARLVLAPQRLEDVALVAVGDRQRHRHAEHGEIARRLDASAHADVQHEIRHRAALFEADQRLAPLQFVLRALQQRRRCLPACDGVGRRQLAEAIDLALRAAEVRRRIAPQAGQAAACIAQLAVGLRLRDAHAGLGHARPGLLDRRHLAGGHALGGDVGGTLREPHAVGRQRRQLLRGQHVEECGDHGGAHAQPAAVKVGQRDLAAEVGRTHARVALAAHLERQADLERRAARQLAGVVGLVGEFGIGPQRTLQHLRGGRFDLAARSRQRRVGVARQLQRLFERHRRVGLDDRHALLRMGVAQRQQHGQQRRRQRATQCVRA